MLDGNICLVLRYEAFFLVENLKPTNIIQRIVKLKSIRIIEFKRRASASSNWRIPKFVFQTSIIASDVISSILLLAIPSKSKEERK